MNERAGPTPEEVADRALALAQEAVESLRRMVEHLTDDEVHAAVRTLHERREERGPRKLSAQMIRHAAIEILMATLPYDEVVDLQTISEARPTEPAWQALAAGDLGEAERRAQEMLAASVARDWNQGNLIHHAHLVLGHVRLQQGDVAGAEEHLLAAGRTPGSPQLNSFGPNMSLAHALLEAGRDETVLAYLRECATFWDARSSEIPKWEASVRAGEIPLFGANLLYGRETPDPPD